MMLQEQILNEAGKLLADAIDKEIIEMMFITPELILSTGTIYGEPYLTVEPKGYQWRMGDSPVWDEMLEWVIKTFGPCEHTNGPGVWTPHQRWYANNAKFWFKNEEDQLMFVLRWS
jgi:hypothetical protein